MSKRNFIRSIIFNEKTKKPRISLKKSLSGVLDGMPIKESSFNIIESAGRNLKERTFTVTIRNLGKKPGEYKMGQLNFLKEKDLLEIRDAIDTILNLN